MRTRNWIATPALTLAALLMAAGCSDSGGPSSFTNEGGESGQDAEGGDVTNAPDISAPDGTGGGKDIGGNGDADAGGEGSGDADGGGEGTADADAGGEDTADTDAGNKECASDSDCDDANPCTQDVCGNSGCANVFIDAECSDGNPCTTGDHCANGKCEVMPVDCDDDNPCTNDSCNALGLCQYTPVANDPKCSPAISVSYPERGAVLYGNTLVPVGGIVSAGPTPITQVRVNGKPVTLSPQGEFATSVQANYGLNILVIEADAESGATDKTVQAFSFSDTLVPLATPEDGATLPNSAGLWLADVVFDDNNPDLDDLAAVSTAVLEELDLNDLIPSPLTDPADGLTDFLWCSWTVDIPYLTYQVGEVDLVPTTGGLILGAVFTNVSSAVNAVDETFGCPDLIGTATAESMDVVALLTVSVNNNVLSVDVQEVSIQFNGVDIEFTSGIAVVANFVLDYFEDNLAALLEGQLAEWLPVYLVPTINDLIGELVNYDVKLQIPSFLSTGVPVEVSFFAEPSAAVFNNSGGAIAMNLGAAAVKKIDATAPGTFARGACGEGQIGPPAPPPAGKSCAGQCGGASSDGTCYCDAACIGYGDCCSDSCDHCGVCVPNLDQFPWSQTAAVEAVVHEDLANQLLFALWWGGGMNLVLSDTELAQFRTTAALSGVNLELQPAMAPIATTCTDDGKLELQLGDLFIDTSFQYSGVPVDLQAWVSARVEIALTVEPPSGGGTVNEFGLQFVNLEQFEYELVAVEGLGTGGQAIVSALLSEELIQFIVEEYLAGAVGAFPLPAIDMGAFVPGVPENTNVYFNPTKMALDSGYLEIIGKIDPPQ